MRLASALLGGLAASFAVAGAASGQTAAPLDLGASAWSAAPVAINLHTDTGAWRGLVWPPMSGGAIEQLSLATGDGLYGPSGRAVVAGRYGDEGRFGRGEPNGLSRDWPSAFRMRTLGWGIDVTPRAGVGFSDTRGAQRAGALLRVGRGVGFGQGEPGRRGRWYLFASTDREQLGLGFLRGEDAWKRAGLGPDPGATIGDTRAGVAWRDGPFEASVGYLYREIKPHDFDMIDAQSTHEEAVGFKVAFHPGAR